MWAKPFDSLGSLNEAAAALPGAPHLVLMFGDTAGLRQHAFSTALAERWPQAAQLACSTGTTVCGAKLMDNGFSALVMGFDRTRVAVQIETIARPEDSRAIGQALGRRLAAPDLAGIHLMTDGLVVNGSALIHGLQDVGIHPAGAALPG
ncbi:FIST N-terminal domain-containing protein [Novosphingobium piscinae]|uniref:FIST N-terminal domain-containing protein n=1 Tax=Novosphingobium piscinae TaxID=1507448 RepID=UPI0036099BC5